jgi:D-alanyl-D-alanine carboxypeptidase
VLAAATLAVVGAGAAIATVDAQTGRKPLDRERLARRVQAALDSIRSQDQFPGATAAYVLPDGTTGELATGLADLEARTPMRPESRMLGASTGKTFVAATALALAKEGRLSLGDPVSRWLGRESWYPRIPNAGAITVRQLLTHSSGVPDHVYDPRYPIERERQRRANPEWYATPQYVIEFILDKPAHFAPGTGFHYTDTGYHLAGLVIEAACGCRYYDEAARRFLTPLGLDRTSPSDRRDLPGLVPGYLDETNHFGLPTKTMAGGKLIWNPRSEWTGGGMATNSRDLARWAKALYEGKALPIPYLADLIGNAVFDSVGRRSYGLAVSIAMTDLGPKLGHGGWIPGYRTDMAYYPDWGFSLAIQMNTDRQAVRNKIGSYALVLAGLVRAELAGR